MAEKYGPIPYVHSRFQRKESDHYPTIDSRCVQALVDTWIISGVVVDCCAPQGSGIVDELNRLGCVRAVCADDVLYMDPADWIVTNPPYKRGLVDTIATDIVAKVRTGAVRGAALLMRANWDLAACRAELFADPLYRGQTRMRFRPFWSDDRKAQPVHNFSWHIWSPGSGEPIIRYWPKP